MFKNYFVIAIRNFRHHKIFSLINIIGLSIGIAASLVIYLIVDYHLGFDTFHKDRDRIYRVVANFRFSGVDAYFGGVSAPLYNAAKTELTGVQASAAFFTFNTNVQVPAVGQMQPAIFKNEGNIVFTDGNYFKLFPHTWLAGSANSALTQPFTIWLLVDMDKRDTEALNFKDGCRTSRCQRGTRSEVKMKSPT